VFRTYAERSRFRLGPWPGRVSQLGLGSEIPAQVRRLDGSGGACTSGTSPVGEVGSHMLDSATSAAQFANGKLQGRRSKDSLSTQFYACRLFRLGSPVLRLI
jgi:hypothetical protein